MVYAVGTVCHAAQAGIVHGHMQILRERGTLLPRPYLASAYVCQVVFAYYNRFVKYFVCIN